MYEITSICVHTRKHNESLRAKHSSNADVKHNLLAFLLFHFGIFRQYEKVCTK